MIQLCLKLCQKFNINHTPENILENETFQKELNWSTPTLRHCANIQGKTEISSEWYCRAKGQKIRREEIGKNNKLHRCKTEKRRSGISFVSVIPILIGAVGIIPKDFKVWLEKLNLKISVKLMQKATLLSTERM